MGSDREFLAATHSEGLAGFIAFKTDKLPSINDGKFEFADVSESEYESYQSEYVSGGFSQVQQFVVMCGQKRRSARTSYNSNKG